MIIRTEQQRMFERRAVQDFIARMEKHLRSTFPETTGEVESPTLISRIDVAIQIAKKLGLTRECDVEGYLNVMCALRADLGSAPPDWILEILADDGTTTQSKIELLYSGYRDRQQGR